MCFLKYVPRETHFGRLLLVYGECLEGIRKVANRDVIPLYTAPGQASPPRAESVYSGHNNLEKRGRFVDSLTELC